MQVDAFLCGDRDALLLVGLEARPGDLQAVGSRHQAGKDERAVRLGRVFADGLREVVGQLDCGPGNDRPGGIHHDS